MKRILTFFLLAVLTGTLFAQTSLYLEDFDTTPISMTASSTGSSPTWGLNNTYSVSGTMSDSAAVQLGDTLILESNSFSTVGFSFLSLTFSQICKVDFFDKGIIEYSSNNGSSWTQLTSAEYTGSGFMSSNSFSAVSYSIWDVANGASTPANSWWQNESFDLSGAANQTQVKVRFLLIDADNNGARNNYGWLLDDVEVLGSPCELIPPTIALTGTVYQGAVFGTGPYLIEADIQDASGISSATLDYTVNGGSQNTLTMTLSSGTTYQATIPARMVDDTVCYTINATDNTTCSNMTVFPSTGCTQFIINPNAPPNCVGNPVSNYNYSETFATFTAGNGQGNAGLLNNDWENSTTDTHDWWVYNQGTRSNNTGPTADHSPGDANYMYIEASGFNNQTAILNTPCYNFSGLSAPKFSYWYHMNGNSMGELHLDLYNGNGWIQDIVPAVIGDQGNAWLFQEVDLTSYAGNIVQLRFRGIVGGGFTSDIAIDDIQIIEPIAKELSFVSFVTPNISSCNGSTNELVTIKIENLGSATIDTIPVAYQVNGGSVVRDTAFFSLSPSMSFNHTFQQGFDMSTPGNYSIDSWIELPGDGLTANDSLFGYSVSTNSQTTLFPDTASFDAFTPGTPGTFLNGWSNDPNNVFDWFVNTGGTPSQQTGPTGDTSTVGGTGNYIYYEATNVPLGEEGSLSSGCLDLNNLNKPELTFYYHMSGIEMGELHLDININGFLVQDIIPAIIGDQGSAWNQATVDLTAYKGDIILVFRAKRGNGYRSDIAIDQVSIRDAMPVGISELTLPNSLNVYPNPFEDKITFEIEESSEIEIYSLRGKLVKTQRGIKGINLVELNFLESGVYFLNVRTPNGILTRKIIKN